MRNFGVKRKATARKKKIVMTISFSQTRASTASVLIDSQ